jgi:hypothetical protein
MRYRVLDDERGDALRMDQGHPKADGAALILHVQHVARQAERLGELIHDHCQMIKRIGNCFRVGPLTMSEPRVIGCDEVIALGKPSEQGLEHSRG